jgi:hypothetical protein
MKVSKNPINLYNDTQLYNIKKIISIENEDDLNNFWNFLVTSENTAHTLINTFISHFYNFVLVCFDRKGIQSFNVI